MKTFLVLIFSFYCSSVFAVSSVAVPMDLGLKQVYVTDQNGNGLFDSQGAAAPSVSLGNSVSKSQIGKTGLSNTSSTTRTEALAYTTTGGKTFYITYLDIEGKFLNASATAVGLGTCSLEIPRGTTIMTYNLMNPSHSAVDRIVVSPAEPLIATGGQVVVGSCIPAGSTVTTWQINFGGYEK